jgi:hypothetical protein
LTTILHLHIITKDIPMIAAVMSGKPHLAAPLGHILPGGLPFSFMRLDSTHKLLCKAKKLMA